MKEDKQLGTILKFISSYDGKEPLILFLKKQFRQNPQMGSRDRRNYISGVISYFRIGKSMPANTMEERIAAGTFLCEQIPGDLAAYLVSKSSSLDPVKIDLPLNEKTGLVKQAFPDFKTEEIFPFKNLLSEGINFKPFSESILLQPKVWIRAKPGKISEVKGELNWRNIPFVQDNELPEAFSFDSGEKLVELDTFHKGYFEIQDWSSQKISSFIKAGKNEKWWDACAGSGGKSLNVFSHSPDVSLFCTDIRSSILQNLEVRFRRSGLKNFRVKEMDLASKETIQIKEKFDGIIADVPCTGSGTWARSPEQISFFDVKEIERYSALQKKIVSNLIPFLKPGKQFFYITCSVFKQENEEVVEFIKAFKDIRHIISASVSGTSKGADSMFLGVFEKT